MTWMIFWGNFLLVNGLTTQYLKTRSKFKYLFDSLWWSWSHWRGRFQNLLAFWGHKTSFLRYIELTFEVWKFVKSFFAHYICSIFSDNQSKLNNWLVWSYCLIFKEMGYWFSRTSILKNHLIRVSQWFLNGLFKFQKKIIFTFIFIRVHIFNVHLNILKN